MNPDLAEFTTCIVEHGASFHSVELKRVDHKGTAYVALRASQINGRRITTLTSAAFTTSAITELLRKYFTEIRWAEHGRMCTIYVKGFRNEPSRTA